MLFEIPTQLCQFFHCNKNSCLMETSLKVAKFMESPLMPPLLRHTHHHFLFSPKHQGVGFKTKQEKSARRRLASLSREEAFRSLHLNKVRAEVIPWEQYAEVLTNHSYTSLPARSTSREAGLRQEKGVCWVRNMRRAWLLSSER